MKTLITTIAILMISISCYANEKIVRFSYSDVNNAHIKTVCISGYLFAVVKTHHNNGVSIVQVYERSRIGERYPAQPKTCK